MLQFLTLQLPLIVPLLLAYLAGAVVSLVHLRRHTRPTLFALVACGLMFLAAASYPVVQGYIMVVAERGHWRSDAIQWCSFVAGAVRTVLHLAAFGLLLTGVFVGRGAFAVQSRQGQCV